MKEQLILEITSSLRKRYSDFKGIYLFGSQARGEEKKDSDWDFAIVFDRVIDWRFKDEVRSILYNIMLHHDIVIDSHIHSLKEIQKPRTPFLEEVQTSGIYYAA